jgi:hypothetical protein
LRSASVRVVAPWSRMMSLEMIWMVCVGSTSGLTNFGEASVSTL